MCDLKFTFNFDPFFSSEEEVGPRQMMSKSDMRGRVTIFFEWPLIDASEIYVKDSITDFANTKK